MFSESLKVPGQIVACKALEMRRIVRLRMLQDTTGHLKIRLRGDAHEPSIGVFEDDACMPTVIVEGAESTLGLADYMQQ